MPRATQLRPETAGADPDDLAALRRACAAVDSGLLVLTGADTDLSFHTAAGVALEDVTGRPVTSAVGTLPADVHLARPAKVRWTVGEVQELIVAPGRQVPLVRAHIVVADAHTMPAVAADRLLKCTEEPRGDVLYWLCTPDLTQLAATLRSRAARVLQVRAAPVAQLWDELLRAGASTEQASMVTSLTRDPRLALSAVTASQIGALQVYCTFPQTLTTPAQAPVTAAASAGAALVALARASATASTPRTARPRSDRKAWDELTDAAKAEGRVLLHALLHRTARHVEHQLETATSADGVHAASSLLDACARARTQATLNVHPFDVLAGLAAVTTVPPAP